MKKTVVLMIVIFLINSVCVFAAEYPYDNPYITDYRVDIFNINITAEGHGSVSPSGKNIRAVGSLIDVTVTPDAGYTVDYVTINGVKADCSEKEKILTINGLVNNADIKIIFKQNIISVSAYENKYKGYIDLSNNIYDVVFASVSGKLVSVKEAGFEIDGKKYKLESKYLPNLRKTGTYGIGFCDIHGIYEDEFITRPYIVLSNDDITYGEYLTIKKSDSETYEYAEWSERANINTYQGTEWRFRPSADYISEQNPPDFSWPFVEQADSYDLIIAKDRDFKTVYASAFGLNKNYYNFNFVFDEDVYFYKVRFHNGKKVSRWSEPRRFTIKSGASEFPVDDINLMLSKIPESHPRIAVNNETKTDFKEFKNGDGMGFYTGRRARVNEYLSSNEIQEEPSDGAEFENAAYNIGNQITSSAWIYYVDNDAEAGEYAKRALLNLASWNPNGTSSYVSNDLRFRDLIYYLGFGYTYLNNILSEEEKSVILSAVKTRAEILINPSDGVMDTIAMLEKSPYQSHGGSALRVLLQTALCVYNDLPEAENWLREYLPMYINYFPNWGYQDGGWSQGTGYGSDVLSDGEDLRITLYINDMVNMYNKPFFKNYYNNYIYNLGAKGYTGAEFGDQATGEADSSWALSANNNSRMNQNRYAKWFNDDCGFGKTGSFSLYYSSYFPNVKPLSPTFLPKSHYFKDIGWVSMLSDMNIKSRLAAYFKSSSYGSHNHSHSDQNSFTISRNGNRLAIDSGYYDGYGSSHYSNYYKATYAHNAITHDGGKGQSGYAMIANGDVVNYLSSDNITLASGDALNAYNYVYDPKTKGYKDSGTFEKVKRHFIYLRPETFIVIDDVKYKDGNLGTIEWWMNGWNFTSVTDDSAIIKNKTDCLNLKMQYPENLSSEKYIGFVNPNGIAFNPNGEYANMPQSDRVKYTVPAANKTRIVATMNVYGSEEVAPFVTKENGNGYIKLSFSDGSYAYINLTDGEMNAGEIKTDALAVVVKNNEYMMIDGTKLTIGETCKILSDNTVSVLLREKGINISAAKDSKVRIYGVNANSYKDEYNNFRTNLINDGVTWEITKEGVDFSLLKGSFELRY